MKHKTYGTVSVSGAAAGQCEMWTATVRADIKLMVINVSEEEIWTQTVRSICSPDGPYNEERFAANCRPTSSNRKVIKSSGVPRNFFSGGGFNKFS